MPRMYWTEEEVEILKDGAQRGFTIEQLLDVLKSRTRNSITNKAYTLGLSLQGGRPEIDREAYRRHLEQA